jgi:hypothetical protein
MVVVEPSARRSRNPGNFPIIGIVSQVGDPMTAGLLKQFGGHGAFA